MKIEAILLHSERFAELADFYRRADESPGEIIARVRDPAVGNVLGLLADT